MQKLLSFIVFRVPSCAANAGLAQDSCSGNSQLHIPRLKC